MKKIVIGIVIFLTLIILVFLGFKLFVSSKKESVEVLPTPTIALPTISDSTVVDLKAKNDNKAVLLKINGITSDIESIQYELTYTTGGGLPRGVLGKISLKGEKEVFRDDIVLGTCSSGRCVYDIGVTEVNLSLKFNSASGSKVFQKTYILSS